MRAGESMREATSRPVCGCVAESRGGGRRWPATIARGRFVRDAGSQGVGERARGRRRGCGSGRGRGGRWPRRAVRGASLTVGRLRGRRPGDGEGVRGNRGGSRGREGRPVGGGRWGIAGERAGGRTRWGRGERGGSVGERGRAWATVAGDSPVGGGPWVRADGCRGGSPVGSGVDQLAVDGWHGRENTRDQGPPRGGGPGRHGGAAVGRRDARAVGERRRQESALSPAGDISRRHARTRPVRAYIYIYPCTFPSTHHGSPAHAW